jgi:hypothetical protein
MLPDDLDPANYLASKIKLEFKRWDLAEIAQYVREIRGEPNISGGSERLSRSTRNPAQCIGIKRTSRVGWRNSARKALPNDRHV